jgi:integrase
VAERVSDNYLSSFEEVIVVSKSSRKNRLQKPREDFPLFPHDPTHPQRSRWAKKIRGHLHYFGKVLPDDRDGQKALALWLEQKDDLLAGRKPRPKCDGLTVDDLVNRWLHSKRVKLDNRELSIRTWEGYKSLGAIVIEALGRNRVAADLQPEDFAKLRAAYAKRWGAARLGNAVGYSRGMFRWAYQEGLLAVPMRFGASFSKPSTKTIRQARNAKGPRMFEPTQLRVVLDVADVQTKALVLLGINAALGPTDLASMPIAAVDQDTGWLNLPRQKTGVPRRIPLWPETVAAIREVLASRPEPKRGSESLVFLSSARGNYAAKVITQKFRRAAKKAGVTGRAFYDLRRTFQTVADGAKDAAATSAIMGHAARGDDMSAVYRQRIDDDRLQAVVAVVHDWLFGERGGTDDQDDRQKARQARQEPSESTPIQRAVIRCLQAIEEAEGQDKAVLRSVWNESEIMLALSGESRTVERFIRTWGDDAGDRPRLRIVNG